MQSAVKFVADQPAPRVEIGATLNETVVSCQVRDKGAGIEQKYQERVFGLFDRLDQSVDGTGIGLALAKRIVEVQQLEASA